MEKGAAVRRVRGGRLSGRLARRRAVPVRGHVRGRRGRGRPRPLAHFQADRAASDPPPPPSEFRDRLNAAKPGGAGKTGDVQISLIWFNSNDLDLHCDDPNGFEIYWKPDNRRSRSGGELDVDRNAGCQRITAEPVENIYWARDKAPMGKYSVYLDFYQRCPDAPNETEYKVNVLHGGHPQGVLRHHQPRRTRPTAGR